MPPAGKLYLEIPHLDTDLLYTNSLPYGTGSNDLGLDRGQISEGRIVRFERSGPKVLLVQPNSRLPQLLRRPRRAARRHAILPRVRPLGLHRRRRRSLRRRPRRRHRLLSPRRPRRRRNARRAQAGHLQSRRHALHHRARRHQGLPEEHRVEAVLTFTTEGPLKAPVRRRRHARPARDDHPRAPLVHRASAARLHAARVQSARRLLPFRLSRLHRSARRRRRRSASSFAIASSRRIPNCTSRCEPVTPIQYYVDRGAPEPIRTALVEGARWWDQAFQAAGWAPGTFRVDLLARRRRPHGHSLQHHPVGPPLHPRLELRRSRSPTRAPARSSRATSR